MASPITFLILGVITLVISDDQYQKGYTAGGVLTEIIGIASVCFGLYRVFFE